MPKIGDIKRDKEIGFKDRSFKFIWSACADCRKERWVRLVKGKPQNARCNKCGQKGNKSQKWKGGRTKHGGGYIEIWVDSTNPFAPMRNINSRILEHRLIMAQHLNRCLKSWEIVHHINGIRDDNRKENLKLLPSQTEHLSITILVMENRKLKKKIKELEEVIKTFDGGKL